MWDRSDADDTRLLDAARDKDREAYAELYRRHRDAAVRFGTRLTGDTSTAHDLASEAFVKLMRQLDRGAGPDGRPLAYLMAIMRNLHIDQHRRHGREVPVAEVVEAASQVHASDVSEQLVEGAVVAGAFARLPDHYRQVLWHTEVLGRPLGEVAGALGTTKNAVGVQAFRAREALREAYLAEHLGLVTDKSCKDNAPLVPRYVRGSLPGNKSRQLERHLATCTRCAATIHSLRRMNTDLAVLIVPALALGAFRSFPGGGEASPATPGAAVRGTRAAVAGVGLALGVVALAVLAVSGADDGRGRAGGNGEVPVTVPASTVPAPTLTRRTTRSPERLGSPLPTGHATVPPAVPVSSPPPPPAPPPPPPPPPSPEPRTPTPVPPGPAPAASSLSAPYVTVTRSSGAAALRLVSRVTGLADGTSITLTADNATAPDTTQLDGWRCTPLQPRPGAVRLVCRATRSATPLFSVGLAYADPDAAVTGTVTLDHGAHVVSFVATA